MILFKRQRKIKALIRLCGCAGWSAPFASRPNFIAYPESHLDNTVVLSHLVKTSAERDRFSIPSLQGKLQREKKKVSII